MDADSLTDLSAGGITRVILQEILEDKIRQVKMTFHNNLFILTVNNLPFIIPIDKYFFSNEITIANKSIDHVNNGTKLGFLDVIHEKQDRTLQTRWEWGEHVSGIVLWFDCFFKRETRSAGDWTSPNHGGAQNSSLKEFTRKVEMK